MFAEEQSCSTPNLEDKMGYVLITSSIFYMLQAITMGVVLTILFVKKGNWVAKVLTLAYMLAYCLTSLSFSEWVDGD